MIAGKPQATQPYWLERKDYDRTRPKHFITKERRLRERVCDASLVVAFKGGTYTVANWSLGGFVIEGYRGPLTPGSLISVDAVGKVGGELARVKARARAVRKNAAKQTLAVSFLDLDNRAYEVLHEVMSERMRLLKTDTFL